MFQRPSSPNSSSVVFDDMSEDFFDTIEFIQQKQAIPSEQHRLVIPQQDMSAAAQESLDDFLNFEPSNTFTQQQQTQQFFSEPQAKRQRTTEAQQPIQQDRNTRNWDMSSVQPQQKDMNDQVLRQQEHQQQQNMFLQLLVSEQKRQASEISELKHMVIRLTQHLHQGRP